MNLATDLLKKYPFISNTLEVYTENIFYHLQKFNIVGYTMIICDENTHKIAKHYKGKMDLLYTIPHKRPLPTFSNAKSIIQICQKHNIRQIIAFGTGAINDICKYVANWLMIKYIFVPTALSMNGVVSNNTSLYSNENGVKQSFNARSASIILLDETILSSAPPKFIGSAIMDSLAAYTSYNDMIFASKTKPKEYHFEKYIFAIFHNEMLKVINTVNTDVNSLYTSYPTQLQVFEILYLSGLIMNYYSSSIAFSGGEHNIAHTLESGNPHLKMEFLHGEIISAILPFYASLQLKYNKKDYIPHTTVKENLQINFEEIANKLGMQISYKDLKITEYEFAKCVQNAKYVRDRPTLLHILF